MKPNLKWLLLAPALAVALVVGPLAPDQGASEPTTDRPTTNRAGQPGAGPRTNTPRGETARGRTTADRTTADRSSNRVSTSRAAELDIWSIGSTLLGVLILGGVALVLLRRTGAGPRMAGEPPVKLRHSQRLSPKARLHVVEFAGRMLLVGEADGHIGLLSQPDALQDEAEVLARDQEEEDQGAVPRDMVLTPQGPRKVAPKQPQIRQPSAGQSSSTAEQPATAAGRANGNRLLHDFRSLLDKVKAGSA